MNQHKDRTTSPQPTQRVQEKENKNEGKKPDKVQSKPQPKPTKYKCPEGKPAQFACMNENCENSAIKCFNIQKCGGCKHKHKTCSREIAIEQLEKIAAGLKAKAPITEYRKQNKDEDQFNLMTEAVQKLKKQYLDLKKERWGLTQKAASFIFEAKIDDKISKQLAQIREWTPIYPNTRFYAPPIFRAEVKQMAQRITKFEESFKKQHIIYQRLAGLDCQIQAFERLKQLKAKPSLLVTMVEKFEKLIKMRLQLRVQGNYSEQTVGQEQRDFEYIGIRIFNLVYKLSQLTFKRNQYNITLQFIKLCNSFFSPNRNQFKLNQQAFMEKKKNLIKMEAQSNYDLSEYSSAYQYFKGLDRATMSLENIQKLITISDHMSLPTLEKLEYLLLLQNREPRNLNNLIKILSYFEDLKDRHSCYKYTKKIIEVKREDHNLSKTQFTELLKRYKFCMVYQEELQEKREALRTIGQALGQMQKRQKKYQDQQPPKNKDKQLIDQQHVYLILQFRLRMVLLHRSQNHNTARTGAQKCEQYIKLFDKMEKSQIIDMRKKREIVKKIKQFRYKFLLIEGQGCPNDNIKYAVYEQARLICIELKVKIFEPYYQLAMLAYSLQKDAAMQYQDQAIKIYPTAICYSNKAFLLYKKYVTDNGVDRGLLEQCIKYIDKSLLLHIDPMLYHLRGIANQNLDNFKQSNEDLAKVPLENENTRLNVEMRIAENYEFLAKELPRGPEKKETLEQSLKLYQRCMAVDSTKQELILGIARVMKQLGKLTNAEEHLRKLLNSQNYKLQTYKELGNIRQQLAIQDDNNDFDLLQQALDWYKKAGETKDNLLNLIRVHKRLGNEREALELQAKLRT